MATLPRGITLVRWKNKNEKKEEVRYRVRIDRKDLKIDKVFERLDEAEDLIDSVSTKRKREKFIQEQESARQEMIRIVERDMAIRKFKEYVDTYKKKYISNIEENAHAVKKRSVKINENRISVILKTLVPYVPTGVKEITGFIELNPALQPYVRNGGSEVGYKELGDFDIDEIDESVATSYIEERLKKGLAKSTIRREIGQLQTIFSKLKFFAPATAKLLGAKNPFEGCDKSKLKGHGEKRERRLEGNEEEKLFLRLASMRNPAMLQITALALATGMRRSEVLYLEWEWIAENSITLPTTLTKTNTKRKVFLNEDAKQIIKTIQKVDGQKRLFKYTIEGFKTNFYRAVKQAGIENLHFHDFRREYISRMVQALATPNAVFIAQMAGMKSVRHVEDAYMKKALDEKNESVENVETLMKSVGHTKITTLAHYTTVKRD